MRPATLALLLALTALAALAPGAEAQRLKSRTQWLLDEAPSPAALRERLVVLADSAGRRGGIAGEAWYYIGRSWERAGALDSAIAAYRRAVDLRGNAEDRIALADLLMARGDPADVAAAELMMAAAWAEAIQGGDPFQPHYRARQGWACHLLGRAVEAWERYEPVEAALSLDPVWRERMAAAALERGDAPRAWLLALPLVVQSRGKDAEVLGTLRSAADRIGAGGVETEIQRAIDARDHAENAVLERLKARRIAFPAADGFPLAATWFAPERRDRRPPVVAIRAPGDTLPDWDSLGVRLRASGRALLLLDLRGHGGSVGPDCALPQRWWGREDAMAARCAEDVRAALRALAMLAPVDTTRYAVMGSGAASAIALDAAERDPRVEAVLLLSPDPDATERGLMRARLSRMQVPGYFQMGVEDRVSFLWVETLYQAGLRNASRVVDARGAGRGPAAMRRDPESLTRLVQWLDAPKPPRARPDPRPRAPRRG
jgi:dienelactone hydrolase